MITPADRPRWRFRRGGAVAALLLALLVANLTALSPHEAVRGEGARPVDRVGHAPVTLLRSDASAIVVDFELPPYEIIDVTIDGVGLQMFRAGGLVDSGAPGEPALPVAAVLLGIPPGGDPNLRVTLDDESELGERIAVAPVADLLRAEGSRRLDPEAYASDRFAPAEVAAVTDVGWIRDQRFARLELRPFQYRAGTGEVRVHRRIRVEVSVPREGGAVRGRSTTARSGLGVASAPDGAFESVLRSALLNYETSRSWRAAGDPGADQTPPTEPWGGGPLYNIAVEADGVYRLNALDLALEGMPIDEVDPRTLRLLADGREVAIIVIGEADGGFGARDAIVFYGQASRSRYTSERIYQLTYGGADGQRMAQRDGAPGVGMTPTWFVDTRRVERDLRYVSDRPRFVPGEPVIDDVDRWYWAQLSETESLEWSVDLPGMAPGAWTGVVRVAVVGKSAFAGASPDHHLRVHVAGEPVGDLFWDGDGRVEVLELPVPSRLLTGGSVPVQLRAPGGTAALYDQFYVDWVEIDYQRTFEASDDALAFAANAPSARTFAVDGFSSSDAVVYDVADPVRPVYLTDVAVERAEAPYRLRFGHEEVEPRRYLALTRDRYRTPVRIERREPPGLHTPSAGADTLIIAHGDFVDAVQPLADHRTSMGQRLAVIDVGRVYDAFGDGYPEPEAIRDFVAHAYHHWPPPAPSHVLLVGDGNYDPRNRLGVSDPTFVPPFLTLADPWLGEVASDNAFVTVSGDDVVPDLHVGRLPVGSVEETAVVVRKIIDYETSPPDGDWRGRLLFATDDPDTAGDFYAMSDDIAEHHVPPEYTVDKVYLGRTHDSATSAREAIFERLGQGSLIAQYIGHGRTQSWAAEGVLTRSDVEALGNRGRLPVLLEMTCLTGYFNDPVHASVAEAAVRAPGGGAIAAFSPSGFGVATGHDHINRAFMDTLLGGGVTRLGSVTTATKLHLFTVTSSYRDLLETLNLLGDPGLNVPVPFPPAVTATPIPSPTARPPSTPPTPVLPTETPPATEAPRPRWVLLPIVHRDR